MEDRFKLLECNDNDVFSFPGDVTSKVGSFKEKVRKAFGKTAGSQFTNELIAQKVNIDASKLHPNGAAGTFEGWFNEGINYELLTLGSQSWKKGKIKININVEFFVEEDENLEIVNNNDSGISEFESPLDDLKRMINQ
ncbi:MAG: KGK family protein [Mojavia pulchra JT2-VF2]|jgi:hypothetical protein|uniref:KGK family protein n=1 Tax=Mojavia pulchra JT2-VF2 TaxID=287848 RepID=A0A951UIT2_9NOST|nr:KGK family protein [Mojavia pulchra JT2-VF2]